MNRRTVFIHFTDRPLLNEEYGEADGKNRVFELVHSGRPILASILDVNSNTLCITFGEVAR